MGQGAGKQGRQREQEQASGGNGVPEELAACTPTLPSRSAVF